MMTMIFINDNMAYQQQYRKYGNDDVTPSNAYSEKVCGHDKLNGNGVIMIAIIAYGR
jgi:hypothetical protein